MYYRKKLVLGVALGGTCNKNEEVIVKFRIRAIENFRLAKLKK